MLKRILYLDFEVIIKNVKEFLKFNYSCHTILF